MTISRSKEAPTRYKVVVGGWTLIVCRSSLHRAIEAVVVIITSLALFLVGQAHALQERGYEAIGGEYLLLALPVFYYLLRAVIKDYLADLREIRHRQAVQSWERYESMRDRDSDKMFLLSRVEFEGAAPRAQYKIQTPPPVTEWWIKTPPHKKEKVPDDGKIYPWGKNGGRDV